MMGRSSQDQGQLFYSFNLEEVVPDDHLVRAISRVLDLSWVRAELAPHYSHTGRPSIDPVLMIRMLIIGYVFAIRSERALCRELPAPPDVAGVRVRSGRSTLSGSGCVARSNSIWQRSTIRATARQAALRGSSSHQPILPPNALARCAMQHSSPTPTTISPTGSS